MFPRQSKRKWLVISTRINSLTVNYGVFIHQWESTHGLWFQLCY